MPRGNWTVLNIRPVLKKALEEAYEAKKVDLIKEDINTFSKYLNEGIIKGLAVSELTTRFKVTSIPTEDSPTDSAVVVEDRLTRKTFDVFLRDEELWCIEDGSFECVHCLFVSEDDRVKAILRNMGILKDGRW